MSKIVIGYLLCKKWYGTLFTPNKVYNVFYHNGVRVVENNKGCMKEVKFLINNHFYPQKFIFFDCKDYDPEMLKILFENSNEK